MESVKLCSVQLTATWLEQHITIQLSGFSNLILLLTFILFFLFFNFLGGNEALKCKVKESLFQSLFWLHYLHPNMPPP